MFFFFSFFPTPFSEQRRELCWSEPLLLNLLWIRWVLWTIFLSATTDSWHKLYERAVCGSCSIENDWIEDSNWMKVPLKKKEKKDGSVLIWCSKMEMWNWFEVNTFFPCFPLSFLQTGQMVYSNKTKLETVAHIVPCNETFSQFIWCFDLFSESGSCLHFSYSIRVFRGLWEQMREKSCWLQERDFS